MDGWVELLRPVDIGAGLVAPCPSHAVAPATAALLVGTVPSPCAAPGEAGAVALPPGKDTIAAALETAACQLPAAADELLAGRDWASGDCVVAALLPVVVVLSEAAHAGDAAAVVVTPSVGANGEGPADTLVDHVTVLEIEPAC